ncbi:sensor histidine kinase [Rhodococcus fascians]|nr:sensor histidine kinase [Rhodococcus fascians]MBY3996399.1 sensor histidine kinase [Rhodococcus fascians]MBY4002886.1 sensor histidine kinase [Rhodococcus fascians]MBY4007636.1 sensor histidine kinase [Rhodococcus fascians]MBY4017611.1 sensor histidine kinase [Rhodococcus fascians]
MSVEPNGLVERAVAAYTTLLDGSGSPVLTERSLQVQLTRQAEAVVRVVATAFTAFGTPASTLHSPDPSEAIGEQRARSGIHPTQSLAAATLMFEALLPILVEAVDRPAETDTLVALATALQREIQERLAVGSIPYVNYLLTKLLSSQQDERSRIARDLHDRIAHGMGAALQQLDLYDHYRTRDPVRAEAHLSTARESIKSSFDSTRQVSADLWVRLGDESLSQSLASYLESTVPEGTATEVTVDGEEPGLADEVAQELYLLLREAIRNAVIHGKPDAITVELATQQDRLRAIVHDNGCGFDVGAVTAIKIVGGLASIRERAELLGGRAVITADPGCGTTVEVQLPLLDRTAESLGRNRW